MANTPPTDTRARILTIPNALSALRLALVPVFLVLIVGGNDLAALIVLAVASVTDFLDGFLARRLNQLSRLGELLDPAADRLYIFAALIGLAARGLLPWWLLIVIVARDLMLLVLGAVLAGNRHGPLPVNRVGKLATFVLLIALPVIVLGGAFRVLAPFAVPIGLVLAVAGAVLYWWAGVIYAIQTVHIATGRGPHDSATLGGEEVDRA